MAVRHDSTGEVYKGYKGGTTGCGVNTNDHLSHWTDVKASITCAKIKC